MGKVLQLRPGQRGPRPGDEGLEHPPFFPDQADGPIDWLDDEEIRRREEVALVELAETARHHAGRLPEESLLRWVMASTYSEATGMLARKRGRGD